MIALTVPLSIWVGLKLSRTEDPGWQLQAAWAVLLFTYWGVKVLLRRRAMRLAPEGTMAMLPSALVPWHFLGCVEQPGGAAVLTFRIDAFTGRMDRLHPVGVMTAEWGRFLEGIPEYRIMRGLSPAYHVIAAQPAGDQGTRLELKDLRLRNFGGKFGAMDVILDRDNKPREVVFHV